MEVVYFVLGMVTVLLVLGIVFIVRVSTLVKELKETVQYLERDSHDATNDIHRRIEDEVRELRSQISETKRVI
jgi:hypothetical protein